MSASLDIQRLISQDAVEVHFQPISSIRRQSVVGIEALSRARNGNGLVFPAELFASADAQNLTAEFDDACRRVALRDFELLQNETTADLLLFVNVHPSVALLPGFALEMAKLAQRYHVAPNHLVVEILESELEDEDAARAAAVAVRAHGFLLALDDVGAGESNLSRVALVRPDILKADRSLISGIDSDYYKREVFKSLVQLSERIGGWIIAEGVEHLEEALTVLDLGGDFMQGYYFARPEKLERVVSSPQIKTAAVEFKTRMLDNVRASRNSHRERLGILNDLRSSVDGCPEAEFEATLATEMKRHPVIESVCYLNERGEQLSATLMNHLEFEPPKTVIFAPPTKGSDHSFKEYFYLLDEGQLDPFFTSAYVPLPSGDLCVTASTLLHTATEDKRILVVHFKTSQ